jgi:hypothetical protein
MSEAEDMLLSSLTTMPIGMHLQRTHSLDNLLDKPYEKPLDNEVNYELLGTCAGRNQEVCSHKQKNVSWAYC